MNDSAIFCTSSVAVMLSVLLSDDSDLEGSFPAPDVIIIGETEKVI